MGFLAASGVCGAACIVLELEAAAHGPCLAQKRQRHGGRFVILVHGAVIQNSGFLGCYGAVREPESDVGLVVGWHFRAAA